MTRVIVNCSRTPDQTHARDETGNREQGSAGIEKNDCSFKNGSGFHAQLLNRDRAGRDAGRIMPQIKATNKTVRIPAITAITK